MKTELAALEELQSLDLEILEHRKELSAIPKNLEAMRSDVTHVGELLQREKDRLTEAEQWRVDREKEIVLQNEILTKSKAKLQAARNEREQKAAQREIDAVRKTIQEREEEALKVMEASDQYRQAIEAHTKEFAELEAQLRESEAEARARMAELEVAIGKTATHRQELVDRVSQKTLRLYERIHKRLGRAIVHAEAGTCTGCNMEILPQRYNEIQRGDKIFQCANCFRIIIFKPPTDTEDQGDE
ncbi:MAG: C4-type zinc ribbon domain-containing protein [Myxococcota bacterium]|nr:C4-type zinc ribbon domain-containing protein [Myxococcota bacterium]